MTTELATTNPARQIVGWIVAGHSQPDIIDAIEQTWPEETPQPLIAMALKELATAGQVDPDLVRGFALEATREIFRKCLEVGDHATALRAVRQINDLAREI